jgi:hypothetical protein
MEATRLYNNDVGCRLSQNLKARPVWTTLIR